MLKRYYSKILLAFIFFITTQIPTFHSTSLSMLTLGLFLSYITCFGLFIFDISLDILVFKQSSFFYMWGTLCGITLLKLSLVTCYFYFTPLHTAIQLLTPYYFVTLFTTLTLCLTINFFISSIFYDNPKHINLALGCVFTLYTGWIALFIFTPTHVLDTIMPFLLSFEMHLSVFLCSLLFFLIGLFILYRKECFYSKNYRLLFFGCTISTFIILILDLFFYAVIWFAPRYNLIFLNNLALSLQVIYIYSLYSFAIRAGVIGTLESVMDENILYSKTQKEMLRYVESMKAFNTKLYHQAKNNSLLYAYILSVYPDAFITLNNGIIEQCNLKAIQIFGFDMSTSPLNKNFIDFVEPAERAEIQLLLDKLCVGDREVYKYEFTLLTPKPICVEAYFKSLMLEGSPKVLISLRNANERKENAKLCREIELEKLKVEFFSNISHELKTPLNVIYSAVQLQQNLINTGEKDIQKIQQYNHMIKENSLRLLRLLNNLLDISRLDKDYLKAFPVNLNIVSLVENITTSIVSYAEKKGLTLIFDTEEEDIFCFVDPELTERIILNLLSNAIKYTPDNGRVLVNIYVEEEDVCISITDTGIGIPEEQLETIFSRFIKVDNGFTRHTEGTGLGLSIVKSLVDIQKGSIYLTSTLGTGTTCIIKFKQVYVEDSNLISDFTNSRSNFSLDEKVHMELSDIYI